MKSYVCRWRGPWFALSERNSPGSIIAYMAGKRFVNESMPCVRGGVITCTGGEYRQVRAPSTTSRRVFDQQYRDRYAGLPPGQWVPKNWLESGFIVKVNKLEERAARAGLPVDEFNATVERFNGFAPWEPDSNRCGSGVSASDPAWAARYGIACQALVDTLLDGEVSRVRSYGAWFAGVVFPGETLEVSIWKEGDKLVATVTAPSRDYAVVLPASS
jgi:MaoC like domain